MADLLTELRQPADAPVWQNPFRAHELAHRAAYQIERLTRDDLIAIMQNEIEYIRVQVERLIRERDDLWRENRDLKSILNVERVATDTMRDERDEALAQVAALREALESYADRNSYAVTADEDPNDPSWPDEGALARAVLTDTAAAAEAHDAKVRREGVREGMGRAFRMLVEMGSGTMVRAHDAAKAIRAAMEDEK